MFSCTTTFLLNARFETLHLDSLHNTVSKDRREALGVAFRFTSFKWPKALAFIWSRYTPGFHMVSGVSYT